MVWYNSCEDRTFQQRHCYFGRQLISSNCFKLLYDFDLSYVYLLIKVVVSIIISSIAIGKALPEIEAIAKAITTAKKVYAIIGRVPSIDIDQAGAVIPKLQGKIEFKNVYFNYPTRPDVPVGSQFYIVTFHHLKRINNRLHVFD